VTQAYKRLVSFLEGQRAKAGSGVRVFSTNRLVDVAGEVPSVGLAGILAQLVEDGLLEQFLRVETALGVGLEDFSSIEQVPDEVYDWRDSHESLRVSPANLRVYYRIQGAA
jgi:hypothetical protein